MTTTVNINADAETQNRPAETPIRPSAETIDAEAQVLLTLKAGAAWYADRSKEQEERLVALVQTWGVVPPNAEKSRRLNGRVAELTVTKSDTISVNTDRVETLRDALEANGHPEFFSKLFAAQIKYEIVDGAESALKNFALPKRLAEKVLNLFGRCIAVKPKKPSLKVVIANPEKPARKPRANKGGAGAL